MTSAAEAVCLFTLRLPVLSDIHFGLALEFSLISRAGMSQSVFRLGHGLDGPEFESLHGQEFYTSSRKSRSALEAHSASCSKDIGVYAQGWSGRGVTNSHLHLAPTVSASGSLTSLLLYAFVEWTRKQGNFSELICLFSGRHWRQVCWQGVY